MIGHTPIPEPVPYGLALLVVYGLGSFSAAFHLYSRYLVHSRISFWNVYAAVMLIVVASGFLLVDPARIFGASPLGWVLAAPVGLSMGWAACRADRAVRRRARRRWLNPRRNGPAAAPGRTGEVNWGLRVRVTRASAPDAGPRRRPISLYKDQRAVAAGLVQGPLGLWSLIAVAALEEVIYRGLLVQVCWLIPNQALAALALAGTVAMFALTHVLFGWEQVLAKLPLGSLALLATLITGSVLAAVVAHVIVNVTIWRQRQQATVVLSASPGRYGVLSARSAVDTD